METTGNYVFRSGKYIGYPVKDFLNLTANLNPAWSVKREYETACQQVVKNTFSIFDNAGQIWCELTQVGDQYITIDRNGIPHDVYYSKVEMTRADIGMQSSVRY